MIRALLLTALLAALGAIAWTLLTRAPQIAVLDAVGMPMAGREGAWMVALTLRNDGPPDRLLGVPGGDVGMLSGLTAPGKPLIVPGGDEAQLAMDGVHAMLLSREPAGALVPLPLLFEKAGEITTRVRLLDETAMDHGAMPGVEADPAPTVTLSVPDEIDADGFTIEVETTDILFREMPEGTAHISGEGHAHLYLNGLKLGRVYAATMGIGALSPGEYVLSVALNTHDHRPYLSGGAPVVATLEFTVP
ncbi:hypothetical protein [Jannaschia seohaensis]|uniref:Copper(I)-binding protein n=1 Tax=Jannaschia seohaensis TaxID=475081 RepID=A0A2Y9C5P5_9RHOB|nr:hypothetical protein [Jannaschia seohaensis]PWJ21273.1 copper(I)-binding protein [Jannaschia seohaensis]SSA41683.1 Copper(I)-binding protein [Jannaschia seohaensis]